jgi:uncharacterized membrane-anchored protein
MSPQMDRIMHEAVAAGLLESAAMQSLKQPKTGERHWSVIVFTALAAWLSAVPLLVVIGLMFSTSSNPPWLVFGIPATVGSMLVLRARTSPLFAEQLAIPCLFAGAWAIAFGVYDKTSSTPTMLSTLMLLACAAAATIRKTWLQTLMGAAIGLLAGTCLLANMDQWSIWPPYPAWLLVAAGWLMLHVVSRSLNVEARTARLISAIEAVSSGVAVACLLGLMWSGMKFLVATIFSIGFRDMDDQIFDGPFVRLLSVMLTVGAGGFLAIQVPALQTRSYAALIGLSTLLTWFAPALGVALLILLLSAENGRYALAAFAGVVAAWVIGGLYHDFQWPLAYKALLLGGVGAAITLIGRRTILEPAPATPEHATPLRVPQRMDKRTRIGILSCGLLVLAVANVAIWQKENVIKTGVPVFVNLAPADPRSLMEGDYMRLNFALPSETPGDSQPDPSNPQVVARTDGRGIVQMLRFHDGHPLGRGEFLVDLVLKNNRWTFVTDAWYFKEGEAARWSRARYGEFRVAPDGGALLVGLRGADLEPL